MSDHADFVGLLSQSNNLKTQSLSECCVSFFIILKKELNIKTCIQSNSFRILPLTVWKISHRLYVKYVTKLSSTNFNLSKWKKNLHKSVISYHQVMIIISNQIIKHSKIQSILDSINSGDLCCIFRI